MNYARKIMDMRCGHMPEQETEESLVKAVAAGDRMAFRCLAERCLPRAYAVARRTLRSPQDAEEAVQDAFTKLWVNAKSFQPDRASFSTWFYRIVVNVCLDRCRVAKPACADIDDFAETLPDDGPNPEQSLVAGRDADHVRHTVQQLPPRQRMAITLCYFQELTNAEAAEAMHLNVKALEGLLVRARRVLRDSLRITD